MTVLPAAVHGQQGAAIITPYAGTGTSGYSGDGGPATSAELYYPFGVGSSANATDLFIADEQDCLVRAVSSSGAITTVAGTTTGAGSGNNCAYGGDGGPATGAEINNPYGVALDPSGNLYVADQYNCLVRKVSSGTISTVAGLVNNGHAFNCGYSGDGGPATSARINKPGGVAGDGNGNLYIADSYNCLIRVVMGVNSPSPIISTFAGQANGPNGSPQCGYGGDGGPATGAQFDDPSGVAMDGSGNLYIADTVNCLIRKVSSNGTISTVAGLVQNGTSGLHGVCGYGGDGGPATSAKLQYPYSVALDGSGNLYIADSSNCLIRKVSVAGIITTVAGLVMNGAPAVCPGDGGDGGPATSALLSAAQGVALDSSGNLYIADTGNHRVRKVAGIGCSQATSIEYLISSLNPSVGGQTVAFTATVNPAPSAPVGSMTFAANGINIGSVGLNDLGGAARLNYASLKPIGSPYDIVATYNPAPGSSFCPSASSALVQTVNPNATTTTLRAQPLYTTYGSSVALSATVSAMAGVTPTGTVSFKTGETLIKNATLSAGAAKTTTSLLPAGIDSLTAVYDGSNLLVGSTSAPVTINVAPATSTTRLSSVNSSIVYGQSAGMVATIKPQYGGFAQGLVAFTNGGNTLGSDEVYLNSAILNISNLNPGSYSVVAAYQPTNSNVQASASSPVSLTVQKDASGTVASSLPNPSTYGQTVTIKALVVVQSPGTAKPSGAVAFYDAGAETSCSGSSLGTLGSVNLAGGTATLKISTLAAGTHNLCAIYEGNGYVSSSASLTETQTVQ